MPGGHAHILPSFCPADQKLTSSELRRNKKAPRDSVGHVAVPFLAKGGASSARVGVLTDGLREPITVAGPRPILTAFPSTRACKKTSLCARRRRVKSQRRCREQATANSPVLPLWLAFLRQRTQAFLRVFQAVEFVQKNVHGILQAVAQRKAHPSENSFLRHGEHRPGMRADPRNQVFHGLFELRFRNQPVHQPQFVRALGGHGFSGEHQFERAFRPDEKRKNGRGQRRENADGDFRLGEARLWRGNDQVSKRRQLRSAPDGRAVHNAHHGLAHLEHCRKRSVKRVQHLENALRGVLADVNASAKDLARGVQHDELRFVGFTGSFHAHGQLAQHRLVQQVVFGAVERHPRRGSFDAETHVLELFRLAPRRPADKLLVLNFFVLDFFGHFHTPYVAAMARTATSPICGQFLMLAQFFLPRRRQANPRAPQYIREISRKGLLYSLCLWQSWADREKKAWALASRKVSLACGDEALCAS